MRKILVFALAMAFMGSVAYAGDKEAKSSGSASSSGGTKVEFVSTGEGTAPSSGHYDAPAVGDPYEGKTVTARDEAGHPLTQKSYENCTDDRCKRAEARWSREGTTYKDDVKDGLRKPYHPTTKTETKAE